MSEAMPLGRDDETPCKEVTWAVSFCPCLWIDKGIYLRSSWRGCCMMYVLIFHTSTDELN